ncbi:phosphoribosyltransferase, partial [Enterococcus lactis]|uniref:phosphoribosyltransferase n=1 Tax=Enterococcus lactis TaxID=357441 RepID=UPI003C12BB05
FSSTGDQRKARNTETTAAAVENHGQKSVKIVTLLGKSEGREVDIEADYVGFKVTNDFVVRYGFDYAEAYRNLPFIGVLKPSVYQSN